jgi:hypothetical protein
MRSSQDWAGSKVKSDSSSEQEEPCGCPICTFAREVREEKPTYTILGPDWTIFGFKGALTREESLSETLYALEIDRVPRKLRTETFLVGKAIWLEKKKRQGGE